MRTAENKVLGEKTSPKVTRFERHLNVRVNLFNTEMRLNFLFFVSAFSDYLIYGIRAKGTITKTNLKPPSG